MTGEGLVGGYPLGHAEVGHNECVHLEVYDTRMCQAYNIIITARLHSCNLMKVKKKKNTWDLSPSQMLLS